MTIDNSNLTPEQKRERKRLENQKYYQENKTRFQRYYKNNRQAIDAANQMRKDLDRESYLLRQKLYNDTKRKQK